MHGTSITVADPARVLWRSVGSPIPDLPWSAEPGECARCRNGEDLTVRLVDVISDKFTGWDAYVTAGPTPRWCPACAWAHTDPTLRQRPWIIRPDTGALRTTPLAALLARPLGHDVAVLVPVSRKKHLLPDATWKTVTTDDRRLPWATREAARFQHTQWLRSLGFSEAALADPVPRFEHLRTLPASTQGDVLTTWAVLDGWRADPAYLAVALRGIRKDKR